MKCQIISLSLLFCATLCLALAIDKNKMATPFKVIVEYLSNGDMSDAERLVEKRALFGDINSNAIEKRVEKSALYGDDTIITAIVKRAERSFIDVFNKCPNGEGKSLSLNKCMDCNSDFELVGCPPTQNNEEEKEYD